MHLFQLLLLCNTFLVPSSFLVTATSPGCKGGIYAELASAVAGYPAAHTFCDSKYPVLPVTSTVAGPTATSTKIVTAPTATITTTISASPSTATSTLSTDSTLVETTTLTETDVETDTT
jgi:hypothetical protein